MPPSGSYRKGGGAKRQFRARAVEALSQWHGGTRAGRGRSLAAAVTQARPFVRVAGCSWAGCRVFLRPPELRLVPRGREHVLEPGQESEDGHEVLPGLRPAENRSEAKRRRTERVKREKINSAVNKDLENRKRSRSNSQSDHSRRGRGRPKTASAKKHEEEREKQEKEVDMYANLSDEKAFVFSVALAEINRKIINQRLIL
uniref:Chromosome 16 open reading frame 87 n=1 Tax=Crocodylus porosus TaxID=8502 RepID=A0A7M4FT71_CROPO